MPGINTGAFFKSLGKQIPGMTNALAQQYGGDFKETARQTSSLLKPKFGAPKGPKVVNGPPMQLPGQQMPMPSFAPPMNEGINVGPSQPMSFMGGNPMPNIMDGMGSRMGSPLMNRFRSFGR